MKRPSLYLTMLLLLLTLSGCTGIGEKTASMSIIYGATAVLSLLLLVGYHCLVPKKDVWFLVLFTSVLVVDVGYFILSISSTLDDALLANRISYLGSVFLPMSMLMIILDVTKLRYAKWLPGTLLGIGLVVFLIAASPGYLDIYYKEVSLETLAGASILRKEYGPWHCTYLFYLLAYFAVMVGAIVYSMVKKKIDSPVHATLLAAAVLVNIGVWLIEQLVDIDLEILSISYIISELFLLGLHLIMVENQRLKELVKEGQVAEAAVPLPADPAPGPQFTDDQIALFRSGLGELTPTERTIYEAYTAQKTTKEIMAMLTIKENTLKFHNKNLYSKLGVSSRKQLVQLYHQIEPPAPK
ncbi:MAG: hypothetical protein IJW45_01960 [Oscillospiraceae bacterium]|nr:hypothetical protein [Oscillospiraceae bacterium]